MRPTLCLGFQVHHPLRFTEEGHDTVTAFEQMAHRAYFPFLNVLYKTLVDIPKFQCFVSISGSFLEHCARSGSVGGELLEMWKRVIDTGRVEVITEPFHYSLSYWNNENALVEQIFEHHKVIREVFGRAPQSVRLLKRNNWEEAATILGCIGFENILLEGTFTEWGWVPETELTPKEKLIIGEHAPLNQEGKIVVSHSPANVIVLSQRFKNALMADFSGGFTGKELAISTMQKAHSGKLESLLLDMEDIGTMPERDQILTEMFHWIDEMEQRGMQFHCPHTLPLPVQELHPAPLELEDFIINTNVKTHNELQKAAQRELQDTFEVFVEAIEIDSDEAHMLVYDMQWCAHPQHYWKMLGEDAKAQEYFQEYVDGLRSMREELSN